jgi:hypothetical protein
MVQKSIIEIIFSIYIKVNLQQKVGVKWSFSADLGGSSKYSDENKLKRLQWGKVPRE